MFDDEADMKRSTNLAVLLSMLLGSTTWAGQPSAGRFIVDLQTWRSEAARDPNLVTVNGAAMNLSPRDKVEAIDMLAKVIKDFSIDIRADGSFVLTCAIGKVKGTWALDGERLVASPTDAESAIACSSMKATQFWLTNGGSGVRLSYDNQANHSLPLTGAGR